MLHPNVIRAWKDEAYRQSLSEAERAQLPANPAGLIELSELELGSVAGGICWDTTANCSMMNCTLYGMDC